MRVSGVPRQAGCAEGWQQCGLSGLSVLSAVLTLTPRSRLSAPPTERRVVPASLSIPRIRSVGHAAAQPIERPVPGALRRRAERKGSPGALRRRSPFIRPQCLWFVDEALFHVKQRSPGGSDSGVLQPAGVDAEQGVKRTVTRVNGCDPDDADPPRAPIAPAHAAATRSSPSARRVSRSRRPSLALMSLSPWIGPSVCSSPMSTCLALPDCDGADRA